MKISRPIPDGLAHPQPGFDASINSNLLENVGGAFGAISDDSIMSFGGTLECDFSFEIPQSNQAFYGPANGNLGPGNEKSLNLSDIEFDNFFTGDEMNFRDHQSMITSLDSEFLENMVRRSSQISGLNQDSELNGEYQGLTMGAIILIGRAPPPRQCMMLVIQKSQISSRRI